MPASPLTSAPTARPAPGTTSRASSRRASSRPSSASRPTSVAILRISYLRFGELGSIKLSAMDKVIRTEAEWREQLTPEEFQVLRQAGTERPFTGEYADTNP